MIIFSKEIEKKSKIHYKISQQLIKKNKWILAQIILITSQFQTL